MIRFTPHQVLRVEDDWFRVDAVLYGGVNQVNLICLAPLTQRAQMSPTTAVPEAILKLAIAGGAELFSPYVEDAECVSADPKSELPSADVQVVNGRSLFRPVQ